MQTRRVGQYVGAHNEPAPTSIGMAMCASTAYAASLIGPPLFGAEAFISSLRAAFAMVIATALVIAVLAALKTDSA